MAAEFAEGGQDDELAGAGFDRFMFEVPGVLVGDVDGVQADFHRGVDVAAWGVADHPAVRFYDFVFVDKTSVGDSVFFGDDFDGFEKALQAGALDLCGLFGGFTFGEENEAVALGQISERFRNAVENFGRGAFKFDDAVVDFGEGFAGGRLVGEFQIGFFKGFAEAAHAVAVLANIFSLRFVENVANVGARVAARLDERDEVFDELFEEDIVLPESVVSVDH